MGLIFFGCDEPKEENSFEEHPTEVTLWGEIYSIDNTTHLDLRENNLTGLMPPEIGNLTKLENLDLYDNQFSGSIPTEIGNLIKLEKLYLNDNELTGNIPLGR